VENLGPLKKIPKATKIRLSSTLCANEELLRQDRILGGGPD
jgi:hypothetical protein